MVEPVGIGGKDSAVNLKITVHNGSHQFIHRVSGTIGEIPRAPLAHTGFFSYNGCAGRFNDPRELPVGHCHGAAGEEDTRTPLRRNALAGTNSVFELIADFVDGIGEPDWI